MGKKIGLQKRSLDWWFFTLLPIILLLLIIPVIYSIFNNAHQILILLIQQLLFYSIILSSTDLGLKTKSRDPKNQIAHSLFIILFAPIVLICVYINQETIMELGNIKYLYLCVSMLTGFSSILLYKDNPESYLIGPGAITDTKEEGERKAQEIFESKKTKTKIKAKWGEDNE